MLYYVYLLADRKRGALYIGMSSDLVGRVYKHKNKLIEGHTSKYGIDKLVYFESTTDVYAALNREKQLKKWNRAWKIELIEKENPDWRDLYDDII